MDTMGIVTYVIQIETDIWASPFAGAFLFLAKTTQNKLPPEIKKKLQYPCYLWFSVFFFKKKNAPGYKKNSDSMIFTHPVMLGG